MLIHLYNGKECSEFSSQYKIVTDMVTFIPPHLFADVERISSLQKRRFAGTVQEVDKQHNWGCADPSDPRREEGGSD